MMNGNGMRMQLMVLVFAMAAGRVDVFAQDNETDRRIADLKNAFAEITDSFRQRAADLEQRGDAFASERDAALSLRDAALRDLDAAVADLDAAANQRDVAVAERDTAVREREAALVARDAGVVQIMNMEATAKALEEKLALRDGELAALRKAQAGNDDALRAKDEELARLQDTLQAAQQANARERFALAYNLGSIYKAARQYDRAEAQFLKALEMNADDPALHYNLGILYDDNLRDARKARLHYERFLALAPNDPDAPNVVKWLKEL